MDSGCKPTLSYGKKTMTFVAAYRAFKYLKLWQVLHLSPIEDVALFPCNLERGRAIVNEGSKLLRLINQFLKNYVK